MKKFFLIIALCCMGGIAVFAQNTKIVKGAVIDKNGNPLPGAVVEATGGAESAVVDADGTFSIEVPVWLKSLTAKYAGMKDNKKKISRGDLVFNMSPKTGKWFVNVIGTRHLSEESYSRYGLMGGWLDNWGGYLKVTAPVFDDEIRRPAVSIGVIKSIAQPVYFYLGAGYAKAYYNLEYCEGCEETHFDAEDALLLEAGIIVNIAKKFNITAGYAHCMSPISNDFNTQEIHFGIGYCF